MPTSREVIVNNHLWSVANWTTVIWVFFAKGDLSGNKSGNHSGGAMTPGENFKSDQPVMMTKELRHL